MTAEPASQARSGLPSTAAVAMRVVLPDMKDRKTPPRKMKPMESTNPAMNAKLTARFCSPAVYRCNTAPYV